MPQEHIDFDDSALIVTYLVSYMVSMYIQVSDPEVEIAWKDWVIGFFASCVGGYIAYLFSSFRTENPGEIMFWTITASVTSPRAFRFISNPKTQDRLINSIFDLILNRKNKDGNDDDRDIR